MPGSSLQNATLTRTIDRLNCADNSCRTSVTEPPHRLHAAAIGYLPLLLVTPRCSRCCAAIDQRAAEPQAWRATQTARTVAACSWALFRARCGCAPTHHTPARVASGRAGRLRAQNAQKASQNANATLTPSSPPPPPPPPPPPCTITQFEPGASRSTPPD